MISDKTLKQYLKNDGGGPSLILLARYYLRMNAASWLEFIRQHEEKNDKSDGHAIIAMICKEMTAEYALKILESAPRQFTEEKEAIYRDHPEHGKKRL